MCFKAAGFKPEEDLLLVQTVTVRLIQKIKNQGKKDASVSVLHGVYMDLTFTAVKILLLFMLPGLINLL